MSGSRGPARPADRRRQKRKRRSRTYSRTNANRRTRSTRPRSCYARSLQRGSPGGAAGAGGFEFQHAVAAWVAVHMLAERPIAAWETSAPRSIACETTHPVDDLFVSTEDGRVFVQAKTAMGLSPHTNSILAAVIQQFVEQVAACRGAAGVQPLDSARDRLVLATSEAASSSFRTHLPLVLGRLRGGRSVDAADGTEKQEHALEVILEHVRRCWGTVFGVTPSGDDLHAFLCLIRCHTLRLETGGDTHDNAIHMLETDVLVRREEAQAAWALLIRTCATYAAQRSEGSVAAVRQVLTANHIGLQAPPSYRADIERLVARSRDIAQRLRDDASIRLGSRRVKIRRRAVEELCRVVDQGPLLVTGEPGAGKSGVVSDTYEALVAAGRDVILQTPDRVDGHTLGRLRLDLGLIHDLPDVLAHWRDGQPGVLILDGLDATRGGPGAQVFLDLIRAAIDTGRWRVVASVRTFDLRYSLDLQELFRSPAPVPVSPELRDPEFGRLSHLGIGLLTEDDMTQVETQAEELGRLRAVAPTALRELLRLPFNLRLAAELLETGVSVDDLTPIQTQDALLDRYWVRRIIRDDSWGHDREAALQRACEQMISDRRLQIDQTTLRGVVRGEILLDLLTNNVLAEWRPTTGPGSRPHRLGFSHHLLFDYAVARVVLPEDSGAFMERLAAQPHLGLIVRPSLEIHFRHVWENRQAFWDLVMRIIAHPHIREFVKLIGPGVAAIETRVLEDLEPLAEACDAPDPERRA